LQEESLDLALHHNLHEHAARAFTNLSYSSIDVRDYPYARRWLDTGINYAVDRDLDSWRLYMLAARARLYLETGRWTYAQADATFVIDDPRTTAVAKIPALAALGLLRARQRAEGDALVDEALAIALPTAEKQRILPVRAARAELESGGDVWRRRAPKPKPDLPCFSSQARSGNASSCSISTVSTTGRVPTRSAGRPSATSCRSIGSPKCA
jgi:hypothetical protein